MLQEIAGDENLVFGEALPRNVEILGLLEIFEFSVSADTRGVEVEASEPRSEKVG